MVSQTTSISQAAQRPMHLNFNSNYFNQISAQGYRHIGISEGTDKTTLQLMKIASVENCIIGNTTGLWNMSNDHIYSKNDGVTTDPMLNVNPTSFAKYNEISNSGGSVTGTFMLIA